MNSTNLLYGYAVQNAIPLAAFHETLFSKATAIAVELPVTRQTPHIIPVWGTTAPGFSEILASAKGINLEKQGQMFFFTSGKFTTGTATTTCPPTWPCFTVTAMMKSIGQSAHDKSLFSEELHCV